MSPTTIPLLLLLLLHLAPLLPISSSSSCEGRRIHILPLPPEFNSDLLVNCSAYHPLSDDLCPHLPNSGLGPKTHNLSLSWYRSDHRLFEPFFHRRLLEYPCLAPDPLLSDAVFLPYYTSLDALRYLYGPDQNSSHLHGLHLHRHLLLRHPSLAALRPHHLFLVSASSAWDLSQPPATDPPLFGTSFLLAPELFNLTVLVFESRAWPWQEQAVPYLTSFHPATLSRLDSWLARARRSRRSTLMAFVGTGGGGGPNIRRSILEQCANSTPAVCEFVDCSGNRCRGDPIRFMLPMLRARFCLHPPGDTPTRRGTFDGIVAGCVPVFFEDLSARSQYGWHMPAGDYGEFSVNIPKEDVVFGGVRIAEVLMAIGREEVARMRERVLEIIPRIVYRRHGASVGLRERMDAFDVAIDGVLRRVRERVAGAGM